MEKLKLKSIMDVIKLIVKNEVEMFSMQIKKEN